MERADRLRALLAINQRAPILTTQECGRAFVGDVRKLAVIETVQPDDCELASACLIIEAELQGRRWAALELLDALMPGCAGLRVCIGSQPEPTRALGLSDRRSIRRVVLAGRQSSAPRAVRTRLAAHRARLKSCGRAYSSAGRGHGESVVVSRPPAG